MYVLTDTAASGSDVETARSTKLVMPSDVYAAHATTDYKKKLRRAIGCTMLLVAIGAAVAMSSWLGGTGHVPPTVRSDQGDSVVNLAVTKCGGPCKHDYTCVVSGTYSQCIDCSAYGNWPYDCPTYDPTFLKAAVETCGMPCDPVPPDGIRPFAETTPYYTDYACELGPLVPDGSEELCDVQDDGSLKIQCERPTPESCTIRFSSTQRTGAGKYAVAMQAAPGAGVSTKFFLYSFGRNESRDEPFNSIAFDVLGVNCGKKETRIWTIFDAGKFDMSKPIYARIPEHHKYITVPFDACADWHIYEIYIDEVKIMWLVDGKVYRKEVITDFHDMLDTVDKLDFQAHLKVFGQNKKSGNWKDMGFFEDSSEEFPIQAWFGSLSLPDRE